MPPPRSSSRGWPRTTGKASRGRRDRSTRGRPGKRSMRSSGSRRGAPRERAREEDFFEREEGVSGSILGEILAAKRRRIAAGEFTAETARARSRVGAGLFAASPDGASFTAALSSSSNSFSKQNLLLSFLSEIKHRSPSAGLILPDASSRIESVACAYRRGGASALSVVIEQDFFGGDPSWLPRAKAASGLPVLMKDFVVDEVQLDFAAALGADAVLLIVSALDGETLSRLHGAARSRGLAVLVEAHDETEIKICGVTREEDVDTCMELGVDWIGLIFAARSPRRLTPERGIALKERARTAKGIVAVFAESSEAEIQDVLDRVRPDVIQMPFPPLNHSKKPFSSDLPFWNTIRVGRDEIAEAGDWEGDALHFDTSVAGVSGGTGKTFDWTLLSGVDRSRPVILAGGLKPENVADAVRMVKPDVVDVASGVESAPGIKDRAKIAAFVREVRGV